ncbi:MAG: (4Fe-4S)-binding protein [Bacteroidetes bacterium 46-16]|nr:MAG: (4Fe-4S)-binding protein [Bacteroidetes bacterium 46-16]
MDELVKQYSNGEITVVWKPGMCAHSKKCWTGLVEVFDPKKKPWIDMQGASTARIIEQVRECPSGALDFFSNDKSE